MLSVARVVAVACAAGAVVTLYTELQTPRPDLLLTAALIFVGVVAWEWANVAQRGGGEW